MIPAVYMRDTEPSLILSECWLALCVERLLNKHSSYDFMCLSYLQSCRIQQVEEGESVDGDERMRSVTDEEMDENTDSCDQDDTDI